MTTGYLAIDMSSWGGRFTDEEAEAAKAAGVRLNIVNTWGEWCRQQAEMTLAHALNLEAYTYLYFSLNPSARVQQGLDALYGFALPGIYWLDAEDDPGGLSPSKVVAYFREAVAAVEAHGLQPGIYTRRSWWVPNTDDCQDFAHLPLWDARYDGVPSMDYFEDYGGWPRPLMKQYAGTSEVGGQSVDINYREAPMIPSPTGSWDYEQDKKALEIYKMLWDLNKVLAAGDLQLLVDKLAVVGVRAT